MFTALLLPLLAAGPVTPVLTDPDPPIELSINNDRHFLPGEAARVYVKTREDGYLLVLHADPDGRVRVLFPLDPHDDNFVRGGKRYEVHGRAGREAFEASITGQGMVYAAVSKEPLRFGQYALDGHWDYQALAPERLPREPEAELTKLVQGMAQTDFDYDVLTYDVIERVYRAADYWRPPYHHWYADPLCDPSFYDYYCRPYGGSYLSVSLTFGRPWGRYYYDPYYSYPYYYDPFYYDQFGYYYQPAYIYYPQRTYIYNRYPSRFGGRRFGEDNYRDRRLTASATTGFRATFLPSRGPGTPIGAPVGRRVAPAAAPVARPEGRVARPAMQPRARSAPPAVERRPVEAHRARPRPAESRREAAPTPSRPNIESRPAPRSEPQGRRVERPRDESPAPERRAGSQPEPRREAPSNRPAERSDDGGSSAPRSSGGDEGGGRRRR